MSEWLLLVAGLLAGFIDAQVGGGGIITLPTLLSVGVPPHTALGTNKFAASGASITATIQYARANLINARIMRIVVPIAAVASATGAFLATLVDGAYISYLVAAAMLVMLLVVLRQKKFGLASRPLLFAGVITLAGAAALYDGFLGPGTGSFLLFGLVFFGMDARGATAHGRVINMASNVAGLTFFALSDLVDYRLGALMLVGTVTGAFIGSNVAVKHGQAFIRPLFVIVTLALFLHLVLR